MTVLITGACGQLGQVLAAQFVAGGHDVAALRLEDLDITDARHVDAAVRNSRPEWVLNCAAYTAVDKAETASENAYRVNDAAVGFVADASHAVGARMVHFSTDYVFSGTFASVEARRSYVEEDDPGPVSVYGASKLAGEARLLAHPVRSIILRTAWLYGGETGNFLATMARLGRSRRGGGDPLSVVDDQTGTPTDCFSLATLVERIVNDQPDIEGLFHASCEGSTTWYGFTREIFTQLEWDVEVRPTTTEAYYEARQRDEWARRPEHSVLENSRLARLGLEMPHWRRGLTRALRDVPRD